VKGPKFGSFLLIFPLELIISSIIYMKRILLFVVLGLVFFVNTSFYKAIYSKSAFYIVIDKSDYELSVYDGEGWLVTFPIVLGNKDQGDKMVQGDRKTPEGTFTIISKRIHNKWCRYMGLDYPTPADVEKFNMRKQQGLIPVPGPTKITRSTNIKTGLKGASA
jgi:murein L,D-transpeptidase YafK